jgi:hypothetical protein
MDEDSYMTHPQIFQVESKTKEQYLRRERSRDLDRWLRELRRSLERERREDLSDVRENKSKKKKAKNMT